MKKRSRNLFRILGWIILFLILELGFLFGKTLPWAQQTFGGVSTEEILFHLKVPLQGTDTSTIFSFLQKALLPSLIEFLLFFAVFLLSPDGNEKYGTAKRGKLENSLFLFPSFNSRMD
jgi:quinol-cytochrome oxidoreductase complex cytochrome b subunit